MLKGYLSIMNLKIGKSVNIQMIRLITSHLTKVKNTGVVANIFESLFNDRLFHMKR